MPGRVEASSRAAASRTVAPLSRKESLQALFKAADKVVNLRKRPTADLELKTRDLYAGKGGVKAVVVDFDPKTDAKAAGLERLPAERLLIDEGKKQFYVSHYSGHLGPLPLPAGVTLRTLLDTGAPRPKNDYQKAIAGLSEKVLDGLPQALRKEHSQFEFKRGSFVSPSGEKMKHVYIDDHTNRIPGGALMIGKKEFWVELIPGYSGDCIGPFELPKGFTSKSLDRAEPRAPRRTTGTGDSNGRGTSGYDSSRGFPDSIGRLGTYGNSSGVTPMRGSIWGSGSSGGGGGGSWGGGGGGGGGS
jgi:hypothetical protein